MDNYGLFLILITLFAVAHFLTVARRQGLLTLDGIFVVSGWVMSFGSVAILGDTAEADRVYAVLMTVPYCIYVGASILIFHNQKAIESRPTPPTMPLVPHRTVVYRPTIAVWALLVLSIVITIAYYTAVGYNVFLLGIRGWITDSSADYTTLRVNSYSPHMYLFPGYVNQFKNIILPALTVVVAIHLMTVRTPLRRVTVTGLTVISLIGLLGTGQRGAFIQIVLVLIVFVAYYDRRHFVRHIGVILLTLMPMLLISTLLLGRSAHRLGSEVGLLSKAATVGAELWNRLFHDNQWSGQMAFRTIYLRGVRYGGDWLDSVLGILPGYSGSSLPSDVFRILYSTNRGTAPPSTWGSVYYNFDWVGVILFAALLAAGYRYVTNWAATNAAANTLELIGRCGTFVIMGTWIIGGIEYVLNAGAVPFAFLWWLGRRCDARARTSAPPPPPPPPAEGGLVGAGSGQVRAWPSCK